MSSHHERVSDIPVVILCGGLGTRLSEETHSIPKGMVTIGGRPILWHIMQYYRAFGHRRFILCLGYRGDVIKEYFLNYHRRSGSLMIDMATGAATSVDTDADIDEWEVACIETGEHAMTGARVKRIQKFVGTGEFMLTYGDGLSDVDLGALLDCHRREARHVTVTGVHPPARFGNLQLEGSAVTRFAEKVQTERDHINGGFFVCNPEIFDYLSNDDSCVLERDALEQLAKDGQLSAYLHAGFWQCMDTLRDRELLESMWRESSPWKRW